MPYELSWDPTDTTLLWLQFHTSLTWQEYAKAFEDVVQEVRKAQNRVNVILKAEIAIPRGSPLPHFREALKLLATLSNLDLFVSVNPGTGLFAKIMVETLTRVYIPQMTGRLPFVETVDEARKIIASRQERAAARA